MAILLALSIVMVVVVRKLLRRRSEFEARDQFVRSEFARFVRAYFIPLAPYPIFPVFIVPVAPALRRREVHQYAVNHVGR